MKKCEDFKKSEKTLDFIAQFGILQVFLRREKGKNGY